MLLHLHLLFLAILSEDNKGFVVYKDGYVCGDEGFNDDAARVICVAIGYDGGHVASDDDVDDFDDADDDVPILYKEFECDGDEDEADSCDYEDFDDDDDDCEDLAAVVCGKNNVFLYL